MKKIGTVKCPICGSTKELIIGVEIPICDMCLCDMFLEEVKIVEQE